MKFRKIDSKQPPVIPPPGAGKGRGWSPFRLGAWGIFLAGLAIAGVFLFSRTAWVLTTGRVKAFEVRVGSTLAGRIARLDVAERQAVVEGQVLAVLDDRELREELKRQGSIHEEARARRTAAEEAGLDPSVAAKVEAARRDLELARERERQAKGELDRAHESEGRAKTVSDRQERLFLLRAATRDQWEKALAEGREEAAGVRVAEAKVSEAQAAVAGEEKLLALSQEVLEYAKRKFQGDLEVLVKEEARAKADLDRAEARLGQLEIRSPRKGVVSWLGKRAGETVDQNDVILSIIDPADVWVEAYVAGGDLTSLRDGRGAVMQIDGVSDSIRGRVSLFYPTERASEPVTVVSQQAHTAGQLFDLIHPVRIDFIDGAPAGLLPEMVARVKISRE